MQRGAFSFLSSLREETSLNLVASLLLHRPPTYFSIYEPRKAYKDSRRNFSAHARGKESFKFPSRRCTLEYPKERSRKEKTKRCNLEPVPQWTQVLFQHSFDHGRCSRRQEAEACLCDTVHPEAMVNRPSSPSHSSRMKNDGGVLAECS